MMLLADLGLAQRLERNDALNTADYAHTLKRLQPEAPARVQPIAGGYAAFMRPDMPVNRCVGLGMAAPVTAGDLDAVETFYRGYGLPSKIDLCPLADRSLVDGLNERDYRIGTFFNVHARPITAADADSRPQSVVHVDVVTPEQAELWATTIVRDDPRVPVPADDPWLVLALVAARRPGVTCFLAWIDSQPVGGAALAIRDGLATFFSTATLTPYRGRGVQTALVAARLAFAARAGCDLASVVTNPGNQSQRNMQRAGFQVVYTRMTMLRNLT
jgi:GNAT superfamily N-acetyltransferase